MIKKNDKCMCLLANILDKKDGVHDSRTLIYLTLLSSDDQTIIIEDNSHLSDKRNCVILVNSILDFIAYEDRTKLYLYKSIQSFSKLNSNKIEITVQETAEDICDKILNGSKNIIH
jgi:hypothetical protein